MKGIPVVKSRYLLLETGSGTEVYNIVPYNSSTYLGYSVKKDLEEAIVGRISYILASQPSSAFKKYIDYMKKNLETKNYLIVDTTDYLYCFFTSDGYLCFNFRKLSNLGFTSVFSAFFYGFVLRDLIENEQRLKGIELYVSNLLYACLVKLFRKSQGLIGFDRHLRNMNFLVALYTYVSLFDYSVDEALRYLTSMYGVDLQSLKLDYDFNDPRQLLKCLNDNSIMSVSTLAFLNTFVSSFDDYSIVSFEDAFRLLSGLFCATITGDSTFFSKKWLFLNNTISSSLFDVVDKIISIVLNQIRRSVAK